MTTLAADRRRRRLPLGLRDFWAGISAVTAKELRGRMRSRRTFAILTVYLLLLGAFAFGVQEYVRAQETSLAVPGPGIDPGRPAEQPGFGGQTGSGSIALSATVGHAIFSSLLVLETLLVVVLAPAFTSGAISSEREKQTMDLLVTTPLSTLGMVLGKLISSLAWVFLLILASIPLASLVFTFGGVGPEDLIRGYVLLFAVAFGMGSLGLFISALVRRTQTATVIAFGMVLVLTLGTALVHDFLLQTASTDASSGFVTRQRQRAPEALLWLNPLAANADLVCTTAPSGSDDTCSYIARVTGRPWFGSSSGEGRFTDFPAEQDGVLEREILEGGDEPAAPPIEVLPGTGEVAPDSEVVVEPPVEPATLGFPRDTFWPRVSLAYVVMGIVLVLLSTQLIAPSRRLRLPRPSRRGTSRTAAVAAPDPSTPTAPTATEVEA